MTIMTHDTFEKSDNGIKFIYLRGSLDIYNSDDVVEYIKEILEKTKENIVVFDMEKLNFISASGVGLLVKIIFPLKMRKRVYIKGVNQKIKEIFDLLGFGECCNFINNVDEITDHDETIFPMVVTCPSCGVKMKVQKSGKIQCSSCKTKMRINKEGKNEKE